MLFFCYDLDKTTADLLDGFRCRTSRRSPESQVALYVRIHVQVPEDRVKPSANRLVSISSRIHVRFPCFLLSIFIMLLAIVTRPPSIRYLLFPMTLFQSLH